MSTYKQFVKECRFHIALSLLVLILFLAQVSIQKKILSLFRYYDGTAIIGAIGPDFINIFQKEMFPSLTYLMAFSYIVLLPCAIIFTFLILGYHKRTLLFKRFSLMFSLNYLIAFPFFMLFNVSTTGVALHSMQPLMYDQFPRIFSALSAIDPLDNCFPSLHVAMILSALLIMLNTSFKASKVILCIGFPLIVFAVLYLGIHWILDVVAGIALALITYYLAKSCYKPSDQISSVNPETYIE